MVHAVKQRGSAEYHAFLEDIGGRINPLSDKADEVLGVILRSRFGGKDLLDLSAGELTTAYDELSAVVWGFHKADPENARAKFSEVFTDYDGYIVELDAIMEGARGPGGAQGRGSAGESRSGGMSELSGLPGSEGYEARDGVGAADAGFDPYTAAQNRYGTIRPGERPARTVDVPGRTTPRDRVSATARTAMEAAATPEGAVGELGQAVVDGKLSYIPVTNRETAAKAESVIRDKGFEAALRDWTAEARSGKTSADVTAMGASLYNAAINAGDTKLALDVLADYARNIRSGAQAVQAARILKTLTPDGQLYMIQKEIDNINERAPRGPRRPSAKRRGGTNTDNVPVEIWMQRVGENLADALISRVNAPQAKVRTVVDAILSDLKGYANETAPGQRRPVHARTEMDRITDLFENKTAYEEAWQAAKDTLSDALENDRDALAAFDDWLESSLEYVDRLTLELTGQSEISIDEALADEYLSATTEEARTEALNKIYKNVAEQIPATWTDRWNAWRYFAMLGNPRTHIRNIAGNAGFVPVRMMKDIVAMAGEKAVDVLSPKGIERTKAPLNPGSEGDRTLIRSAWGDAAAMEEQILGAGKFSESAKGKIEQQRTIFKALPLEAARRANGRALDAEDTWFSRPAYAGALAGWLKANGVTLETADAAALDRARAYAVREAQRATYRDANAFSDFVAGLRYRGDNPVGKGANVLMEGVLPFRRTPANILVRGVEYSPAGLLKGLTWDLHRVRTGELTAAEAVDNISAGLVGTGLTALGALLASMGLVSGGGGGDEQDRQDDLTGGQPYALTIGDKNYTLDWLAPEALPFFVGVELWNASRAEGGGRAMDDVANALGSISEPMLEMSMLQSLQDVMDSVSYSDNKIMGILATAATGYLTQAFPTLLGQLERVGETQRESTYIDRTSPLSNDLQYTLGRVMNKLPGEFQQMPYIDAWGRTESSGTLGERVAGNLLAPWYTSKENETEVDRELRRLHDGGLSGVYPQRASQSERVEGEYLSKEDYVAYAETRGRTSFRVVEDMLDSEAYRALSDEEKADAVKLAYQYAAAVGKMEVSDYQPDNWVKKAVEAERAGIAPADYILYRQMLPEGSVGMADAARALEGADLERKYKGELWQLQNSQWSGEKNPFTGTLAKAGVEEKTAVGILERYAELGKKTYGDPDHSDARMRQTELSRYLDGLGLTRGQRAAADDTFKFYTQIPAKTVPYSVETMSEAAQGKWPALRDMGLTEEEYLMVYSIYHDGDLDAKGKKEAIAQAVGSSVKALQVYRALGRK